MSEAKMAKQTKPRRATFTARTKTKVEGKKVAAQLRVMTTLCHNTAIIFPKELHAVLPWKHKGNGAENKVHVQIDVEGDRVVLSSSAPKHKE